MEKTYIGKVEAFEIALERGIEELPRKGKEVLTVYSALENAQGKQNEVLGKDAQGFYLSFI